MYLLIMCSVTQALQVILQLILALSCSAATCASVESSTPHQDLLADVVVPPARYDGLYVATDEVPYYDGSNQIIGVVTAVCDPSAEGARAERIVRCLFDHTVGRYRLLGESLECVGMYGFSCQCAGVSEC